MDIKYPAADLKQCHSQPLNFEVIPGGLGGVTTGLEKLKANQVSASKLIIHPSETA